MIFVLAILILLAVFLTGMFVGSWLVIPPPKQPPRLRLVDTRPFNGEVDEAVNPSGDAARRVEQDVAAL